MLRLVLRSYGGENMKGRPAYYSKGLCFDSFERAARYARAVLGDHDSVCEAEGPAEEWETVDDIVSGWAPSATRVAGHGVSVTFVNDGPVDESLLARMRGLGEVVWTPHGPVGTQASYTFALDLPVAQGWADGDVVVFVEDDYLLVEDAFVVLEEAVRHIPEAGYFALAHGRPTDFTDEAQLRHYAIVPWWRPAPDRVVGGRRWINILGVTSTFAARVGLLREDRDIFMLCQKPFRTRWLDHETAMIYQAIRPYRGAMYLTGVPGDFVPTLRGVARAIYLLPFRAALNARAARQRAAHYLYAPTPPVAAHMEEQGLEDPQRWESEAKSVTAWAKTPAN